MTGGYGAKAMAGATDPRQTFSALMAWTVAVGIAHALGGASSHARQVWAPGAVVDATGRPYPAAEAVGWLAEERRAELSVLDAAHRARPGVAGARSDGRTGPLRRQPL